MNSDAILLLNEGGRGGSHMEGRKEQRLFEEKTTEHGASFKDEWHQIINFYHSKRK